MNAQEIIDKITSIQTLEGSLYERLLQFPPGYSVDYTTDLVNSINSLSDTKANLLQELHNKYTILKSDKNIDAIQKTKLDSQITILKKINVQLSQQKTDISKNKNINTNNLRLTEINTYYSQQYSAKYKILRMVAIACLPILLIGILKQRYLLSSRIANILATIIVIFALFFIIPAILDIYTRDNMIYNQYHFPFDPTNKSNPSVDESISSNLSGDNKQESDKKVAECVGKECCEPNGNGISYNSVTKKCGKEGFLSGQSSQSPTYLINKSEQKPLVIFNPDGKYYALH